MEIKKLEWELVSNYHISVTSFGGYSICNKGELYRLTLINSMMLSGIACSEFKNVEEAKEMAQRDFENRVLHCLKIL